MTEHFNITATGYSHIKSGKVCQDHSISYYDGVRTVVTACDGHGGDVYVRSHRGSRFASLALLQAMMDSESLSFRKYTPDEIAHNLKLNVLCEWNRLVLEDIERFPIKKSELQGLSDEQVASIKQNPIKAYGSTLTGAMLYGNKLFCVQIGDGGCFLLNKGEIFPAFPESEDEPVANVTYSLCNEDAFEHIHAAVFDARVIDGALLCTDGVLGPYQSIENFKRSFVRPVVRCTLEGKTREVKEFICKLGAQGGIGDDVSLAMILKDSAKSKRYN